MPAPAAGIGRTGVFCILDTVTRQLRQLAPLRSAAAADAAADAVRLGPLVAQLREQRAGMVQTMDQYLFCHAALLEFVRRLASERLMQGGVGRHARGQLLQPQQQLHQGMLAEQVLADAVAHDQEQQLARRAVGGEPRPQCQAMNQSGLQQPEHGTDEEVCD